MSRYLYILMALVITACSTDGAHEEYNIGEGSVAISIIADGFIAESVTKSTSEFQIPTKLLPTAEELTQYALHITGTYYTDGDTSTLYTFDESYESVAAYNSAGVDSSDAEVTTPPYLPAGDYKAVITDNRDRSSEGEGVEYGCFSGEMEFTVTAREYSSQTSVTAALDNSLIRLQVTEAYAGYFPTSTLTITTEDGAEMTIDFPTEAEAEERLMFVAPDTKLYISGSATKQDPGDGSSPQVTFSNSEIGAAKAGEMTTIMVDAASAGTFTVTVKINNDITEFYEEDIDLNGDL